MPATLAPSKCIFSGSSDLITKKGARLSVDSIQMLMCLRGWGVLLDNDDYEEIIE